MRKDYYMVLGITRSADLNKIKKAYRKIVKNYHPDATQTANSEKFKEVTEAYQTLSDDAKRRRYDMELNQSRAPVMAAHPMEAAQRRSPFIDDFYSMFSHVDDFFEGFLPGFFDRGRKIRTIEKDLYVEVILSPGEALTGGLLPVTVPVIEPCPQCHTTGLWNGFFCHTCNGKGTIQSQRRFSLSFPPHTAHGTEVRISLEDIGLRNTTLNITVSVDPTLDYF
jgi:DnaJ-class molecular chaperone